MFSVQQKRLPLYQEAFKFGLKESIPYSAILNNALALQKTFLRTQDPSF